MMKLLTTKALAEQLDVSAQYVTESRVTGVLMGYPAPTHLKMGRTVRYEQQVINKWINDIAEDQKRVERGNK